MSAISLQHQVPFAELVVARGITGAGRVVFESEIIRHDFLSK